jgi:hypothetical protein
MPGDHCASARVRHRIGWSKRVSEPNCIIAFSPPLEDLSPVGIRSWRVCGFPRWLVFYAVTSKKEVVFYRVRSSTMNLVVMKMES